MGHTCHHPLLLHLIFIIIVIFLISFHTLISIDYTNHGVHKSFPNQDSKRLFLFQKLRLFLPLNPTNGEPAHFPASPAPAPGPGITHCGSPAPSPVAQQRTNHSHPHPRAHKAQKEESGRGKRVMTAVLASVGVSSALCAVAMFFGCRKFKRRRKKQRRSGLPKFMSSMKKVTTDPGPDLFYLKSLESAFQPDKYCLKLNSSTAKMCSAENTFHEKVTDSEGESERFASCREIITVHEISECVKHERDGCSSSSFGERTTHKFDHKIVHVEANSDDDDNASFHSFCDSQTRLSNVSATSVGEEIKETHSSNPTAASNIPPPPPLLSSSLVVSSSSPPLSNGSGKAPPPSSSSSSSSSQQVALGKDGCPLPKLKPLHWDKVRASPNSSTVWDKLRSSSFEFDEEMMESLFGYNLHISMKSEEGKAKTPSPSKHVLEPKRLHNITILSKALNVTAEQVCAALIQGEGLSLQDLEALSKMVPTKEEEAKLANYKGDALDLGHAEKLVKAMIQIPSASARIEAMLYRETFEDELVHLKKSFSILEEACKELRSSRLFLKLLEAVLKTGNRMNMGTTRGGAKAFKLDALLKLSDVKGTDGKTSLLHFVVQEIIRSEGIRASDSIMGRIHQKEKNEESYRRMGLDLVSGLSNELCNAKKTATIDLDVVARSVANMREGMRRVQGLVGKEMEGGFVGSMRAFIGEGERKLREVEGEEERVLVRVREITEYFHGDVIVSKDESNPLRIFVIVRDFLSMLDNVCKELRASPRSPNPLLPFG